MKHQRVFVLLLFLMIGTSLQSQSDRPDTLADSTESKEKLLQQLDSEIAKTAETTDRIGRKVEQLPNLIRRAYIGVQFKNRLIPAVHPIEPNKIEPPLPVIGIDTTIRTTDRRKFLWWLFR